MMSDIFLRDFDPWFTYHSKDKEERKRIKEKLIKHYIYVINMLVKLAKGEGEDDFFYSSFVNRRMYGIPTNAVAVREKLKKAWWVEEEDIKQFLMLTIWKQKFTTRIDLVILLRRYLRDYLMYHCKVFSRQTRWKRKYKWYMSEILQSKDSEHNIEPLKSVLNKKNNFLYDSYRDDYLLSERYRIYLAYVLRLKNLDLVDIIFQPWMPLYRSQRRLVKKVKELIHASNVSSRYRKGSSLKRKDWSRTRDNKYPWPSITFRRKTYWDRRIKTFDQTDRD